MSLFAAHFLRPRCAHCRSQVIGCSGLRRCNTIDPVAIFAMMPLFPAEYSCLREAYIHGHEHTAYIRHAVWGRACAGRGCRTCVRTSQGTDGVCGSQPEECTRRGCGAVATRD